MAASKLFTTMAVRDKTMADVKEIKDQMSTEFDRTVTADEVIRALINAYRMLKGDDKL